MTLLRRSHPCLWSSLEAVLEELIVKFRPSTEEEFLATIVALLERAESQTGSVAKAEEQNLASSIQKTLSKIALKYFRHGDSAGKNDERAKRTAEFKTMHKADFEADFNVSASDAGDSSQVAEPLSLEEILTKIRRWKDKLQQQVLVMQPHISLVEASQSLAVFGIGDAPPLWPGSCDPRDAPPPLTIPEQGFEENAGGPVSSASSASAARKAANGAAKSASSLASREGVGGDYGGGSSCIEIPGQYMPNSSSWSDTRPSPELHVKLIRFQPSVDVVRRSDQLVRRIRVLGSDGKHYCFLLQCALSYWTRTDERYVVSSCSADDFGEFTNIILGTVALESGRHRFTLSSRNCFEETRKRHWHSCQYSHKQSSRSLSEFGLSKRMSLELLSRKNTTCTASEMDRIRSNQYLRTMRKFVKVCRTRTCQN